MMTIEDFSSTVRVTSQAEVDAALAVRHGAGRNEFWLFYKDQDYPKISILVNGELSTIHYFPQDGDAGYRSMTDKPKATPGSTTFSVASVEEETEVPNSTVVPLSRALAVAHEFLTCGDLPKSVKWFKL